jgi:hypothetical protein
MFTYTNFSITPSSADLSALEDACKERNIFVVFADELSQRISDMTGSTQLESDEHH